MVGEPIALLINERRQTAQSFLGELAVGKTDGLGKAQNIPVAFIKWTHASDHSKHRLGNSSLHASSTIEKTINTLMKFSLSLLLCLTWGFLAQESSAAIITIAGGSLTMNYDGTVFADPDSSYMGITAADGDFMRYGRYWTPSETVKGAAFTPKQPQEFRPPPIATGSGNPRQPNFRDNRAFLDPLYPQRSPTESLGVNGNGPVASSTGRNRISTNMTFDTTNVTGTVNGLIQTNGVSAWWFANDDLMDAGVAWISWGDLSLRYDPSRVGLGYSRWVFANQLGGIGDIFDTKNVTMNASASGLTLSGELWGSSGDSSDPYNENFATWETYTLMKPNLKVGSFSFDGFSTNAAAVPEPSSIFVLSASAIGFAAYRRRRTSASKLVQKE